MQWMVNLQNVPPGYLMRIHAKGYFRVGHTISNSIAIEGGGDKGSARLSLTHLKNEWIIPNTGL